MLKYGVRLFPIPPNKIKVLICNKIGRTEVLPYVIRAGFKPATF